MKKKGLPPVALSSTQTGSPGLTRHNTLWNTTWQGEYQMQQSAPSLWYRLSQVAPSLLLRHACSSWGNLASNECPLWESCSWWASCSLQPTRPSRQHAGATIILLNLHAWTYSSEPPAASTEFTGRSGDVLLVAMSDHLIFHYLLRRWHKPGDNQLCTL